MSLSRKPSPTRSTCEVAGQILVKSSPSRSSRAVADALFGRGVEPAAQRRVEEVAVDGLREVVVHARGPALRRGGKHKKYWSNTGQMLVKYGGRRAWRVLHARGLDRRKDMTERTGPGLRVGRTLVTTLTSCRGRMRLRDSRPCRARAMTTSVMTISVMTISVMSLPSASPSLLSARP